MEAVTTTVYVSWNGEQFDTEEEMLEDFRQFMKGE